MEYDFPCWEAAHQQALHWLRAGGFEAIARYRRLLFGVKTHR
ncbi:MAG: hypothetical protein ACXVCO_08345 [Ktedonobacterales bacterium]